MSEVRALIGTRKGAFVLTSDATRERWDICGPHFGGWEILSHEGPDTPLPDAVALGAEPFLVVGAMAGGG